MPRDFNDDVGLLSEQVGECIDDLDTGISGALRAAAGERGDDLYLLRIARGQLHDRPANRTKSDEPNPARLAKHGLPPDCVSFVVTRIRLRAVVTCTGRLSGVSMPTCGRASTGIRSPSACDRP